MGILERLFSKRQDTQTQEQNIVTRYRLTSEEAEMVQQALSSAARRALEQNDVTSIQIGLDALALKEKIEEGQE